MRGVEPGARRLARDGLIVKRSDERILTTHTGSLPRPADLVQLMFAKEDGQPVQPIFICGLDETL